MYGILQNQEGRRLNSMSNEVDYRLARILFANMCQKKIFRSGKDRQTVRRAMLERYKPLYTFLEQDNPIALETEEFIRLIGSKMVCGRCGRHYGVRPWHSTTYNDRVYECLSKNVKKGFCGNSHIYEETMPQIIQSIAELLIKERHSAELFIMNTHQVYNEDKMTEVHRYLGLILSEGLEDLSAERDGLNYIISEIVVENGVMDVKLIDETSVSYELPEYRPRSKAR